MPNKENEHFALAQSNLANITSVHPINLIAYWGITAIVNMLSAMFFQLRSIEIEIIAMKSRLP